MIEILSILDTSSGYSKYRDIICRYNTDIDIKRILDNIDLYYKETKLDTIDWITYSSFFFAKNPLIKEDKKILFEAMFQKLSLLDIRLKESLLETFLERYHAQRIAFLAGEVAEGKPGKVLQTVSDELQAYFSSTKRVSTTMDSACRDDLPTLLKKSAPGTGYTWRMNALNDSLGELPKSGKFIQFAGRPDSGKTSLIISEGTFIATQVPDDKQVFYFVNEEDGSDYKQRIISSLLGVDLPTLESDPAHYWDEYVRKLGSADKIMLIDQPVISVQDIETWLKEGTAGLIIIDQLRNVNGFQDSKGVQRTEQLFRWAREISKEYASVLTVGQLDGSAEGQAYPQMNTLYESKTAAQGTLDAMIMIGVVPGSIPYNARYLGVVKNKMPRPRVPSLRKGQHEVLLLEDIGRFK